MNPCNYVPLRSISFTITMSKINTWHPWINICDSSNPTNYGVVILNCPLNGCLRTNTVMNIWNNAMARVTVDGGTDRWLTYLKINEYDFKRVKPPDLVTGDMDSISRQTLSHYMESNKITHVKFTPDQDETDFTKALRELYSYCTARQINLDSIFVFADTSGRFDQIIANVNTLFKARHVYPRAKIFKVANESLTWLLEEGSHVIHIPEVLRENREWCGLLPIGSSCQVTSTGLKWNLSNTTLEFGGLVSTSNAYSGEPSVHITTNKPILWTMGIESLDL